MINLLKLDITINDVKLLSEMIDTDVYWAIDELDEVEDEDGAVNLLLRLQVLKRIKDKILAVTDYLVQGVPLRSNMELDLDECRLLRDFIRPELDEVNYELANNNDINDVVLLGLYPTGTHTYKIRKENVDFLRRLVTEMEKVVFDKNGNCILEIEGCSLLEYLGLDEDDEDDEDYDSYCDKIV